MSTQKGWSVAETMGFAVCSMTERPSVWTAVWHPSDERWETSPSAVEIDRAFALAAHPRGSLYAVGLTERGAVHRLGHDGGSEGFVLHESLEVPDVALPCRVRVDAAGGRLLIPGYGDGALAVVDLDDDGRFVGEARIGRFTGAGPDPERQAGPHAHDALALAEGIGVIDLGADVLRIVDAATLTETAALTLPPGSGPRHAVDVGGGLLVVSGELDSTLILVSLADHRVLDVIPATSRTGGAANYPSTVVHDADRGLVHLANRGSDTVLTARIEGERLIRLAETSTGGVGPQHLALAGDHLVAVHADDGAVVALRLVDGVPDGVIAATTHIPGAIWVEPIPAG